MKGNKFTPGSNMFWKSSRMMLPEHKEAFVKHERVHDRKDRIFLDEDRRVIGVVEMVDTQLRRRFKVDGEWFEVRDVLRVDIEGYD